MSFFIHTLMKGESGIMKKMLKKKKMTLERLAVLTQNGFLEIKKSLGGEIADLRLEFVDFKQEMTEFKQEMTGFKQEMTEFKQEMTEFKQEMMGFKQEMVGFKQEMIGFKQETAGHFDHIYGKLDDLERENQFGFAQYKRQEKTLTNHETRIVKLEKAAG